jgi:hypothetical protein
VCTHKSPRLCEPRGIRSRPLLFVRGPATKSRDLPNGGVRNISIIFVRHETLVDNEPVACLSVKKNEDEKKTRPPLRSNYQTTL